MRKRLVGSWCSPGPTPKGLCVGMGGSMMGVWGRKWVGTGLLSTTPLVQHLLLLIFCMALWGQILMYPHSTQWCECCACPQSWDGSLAPWAINYPGHTFALSSPCAGEVHKVTQERWSCSAKMKLWGFSTSSFFLAQLGLQQAEWLAQLCNSSAVCLQPFLNLPLPPGPHDQLILHPWGELVLCSFGLLTF